MLDLVTAAAGLHLTVVAGWCVHRAVRDRSWWALPWMIVGTAVGAYLTVIYSGLAADVLLRPATIAARETAYAKAIGGLRLAIPMLVEAFAATLHGLLNLSDRQQAEADAAAQRQQAEANALERAVRHALHVTDPDRGDG